MGEDDKNVLSPRPATHLSSPLLLYLGTMYSRYLLRDKVSLGVTRLAFY